MRLRIANPIPWALVGVVFISVLIAARGSLSSQRLETAATVEETARVTPYAQVKRVKLGDIIPTQTDTADVYVQLIAIEGAILLGVDEAHAGAASAPEASNGVAAIVAARNARTLRQLR